MSQKDNKKWMLIAGGLVLLATSAVVIYYNQSKGQVTQEADSGSVDESDKKCIESIKKLGPPKLGQNGKLEFDYLY